MDFRQDTPSENIIVDTVTSKLPFIPWFVHVCPVSTLVRCAIDVRYTVLVVRTYECSLVNAGTEIERLSDPRRLDWYP